jgi:hypothetical protein
MSGGDICLGPGKIRDHTKLDLVHTSAGDIYRNMSARIMQTREGYVRQLTWGKEHVTIIHNSDTGKTLMQRQDGKTIQIRPEDVKVIDHALDGLSRVDKSDSKFFAFINSLFEQYEALPPG